MDDLGFREKVIIDGEEQPLDPIKIAQISFAYENGWIIDTLKKRGSAIASEKYDDLKKINAEIHDKIVNEDGFLDKIQLPCSVFVTFEDEEGTNRAL